MLLKFFGLFLLAGTTFAAPVPDSDIATRAAVTAESILLAIAPLSVSCANAPVAGECATAQQAAPYLISAFQQYDIFTYNEMAAILSLIAFESNDFQYNINHFPGTPGQGTRNMQSITYNYQYASSIPALKSQVVAIGSSASSLSDSQKNAVRALVLGNDYTWASGAWYYSTQCSASIKSQLQAGGQAGFSAYLGCVGATETDARTAKWKLATAAFGI